MTGRELPPIYVDTYMPSMGALMGTSASSELLNQFNAHSGNTFIAERYRPISNSFMQQIVQPIRQQAIELKRNADRVIRPDEIRALTTVEDMIIIPPCMQMMVLTHPGVRALHESGRISGYGYSPEDIPAEDTTGRILSNGYCPDMAKAMAENNGQIILDWDMHDGDPNYSDNQIGWLQDTRDFMDRWLADPELSKRDITAPDTLVG